MRKLYDSKKYSEALAELTQHPENTPEYHANTGILYFRLNEFGRALAHLERADQLKPYNSDIRHNLALVEKVLVKRYGQSRLDPASNWIETLADQASLEQIRGLLGLLLVVSAFFWMRAYASTRDLKRTLALPAGWVGLAILLVAASAFGGKKFAQSNPPAVALRTEVIRSGPGEQFLNMGQLEPGFKVRATGRRIGAAGTGWIQVRFGPEDVGWIQDSSVLLL